MKKAVKGTYDILPDKVNLWVQIEEKCRSLFANYGFAEIRTPFFEYTDLFRSSIGVDTDIVQKEMYTFCDSKERNISLRPEGTAPIVRSFLEHKIYAKAPLAKYFYIGPMFRHERPQKGRYRQFHQLGVEFIGEASPLADVETITLLAQFLKELKLNDFVIKINSLGCRHCKSRYIQELRNELQNYAEDMCENCKQRFKNNPLRVFDCKEEECQKIVKKCSTIIDYLKQRDSTICKQECWENFNKVKDSLQTLNIPYQEAPYLVRGLDYYTKTVFEITHQSLGAQDAVAAGGRYDNLISDMSGSQVHAPAVGFAIGAERLLLCLEAEKISLSKNKDRHFYLISLGEEAAVKNMKLLNRLHQKGIKAEMNYSAKSVKAQMKQANKLGVDYVLIRGENEIKEGKVVLKSMATGEERKIAEEQVVAGIPQTK